MTSDKPTETHFILLPSGPVRRKSHGSPDVGNTRSRASGLTARCAFSLLVSLASILSAAMLFELAPLAQGKRPFSSKHALTSPSLAQLFAPPPPTWSSYNTASSQITLQWNAIPTAQSYLVFYTDSVRKMAILTLFRAASNTVRRRTNSRQQLES